MIYTVLSQAAIDIKEVFRYYLQTGVYGKKAGHQIPMPRGYPDSTREIQPLMQPDIRRYPGNQA
jgi:hypothetical protein